MFWFQFTHIITLKKYYVNWRHVLGAIWDNIVIQFILVLINIFVSLHNIFMPEKYICIYA